MRFRPVLAALALAGCAPGEGDAAARSPGCRVIQATIGLPDGLGEASGAAWSQRYPGAFWSHNDSGGEPELFLVRPGNREAARRRIPVEAQRDWEDIAVVPCGAGHCVQVADIGDNPGSRESILLHSMAEEGPEVHFATYRARYPDGRARDAEALFSLPDGSTYLITKGDGVPVELYRWPLTEDSVVLLERVRTLAPPPEQPGDLVTGASATPNGGHVAVRTYSTLAIYRTASLLGGGTPEIRFDLLPLAEGQGEGIALADDGMVLLLSESGSRHLPGDGALVRCPLP